MKRAMLFRLLLFGCFAENPSATENSRQPLRLSDRSGRAFDVFECLVFPEGRHTVLAREYSAFDGLGGRSELDCRECLADRAGGVPWRSRYTSTCPALSGCTYLYGNLEDDKMADTEQLAALVNACDRDDPPLPSTVGIAGGGPTFAPTSFAMLHWTPMGRRACGCAPAPDAAAGGQFHETSQPTGDACRAHCAASGHNGAVTRVIAGGGVSCACRLCGDQCDLPEIETAAGYVAPDSSVT